jgi:hypothetical protein
MARSLLIIGLILPIGSMPTRGVQPGPGQNCRYFDQTGHWVCDQFLEHFDTRGQLEIFGYPLSEQFTDQTRGGLLVQYFQRARMEFRPDNPRAYRVQLGLLIDELGYRFPPVSPDQIPAPDDPAHHYFPETQHVVSYAFLDTFREKGGLDIFGYPRSDFMFEDGIVVQYFQRARMEWHRNQPGQPVRLTNVVEWYIDRIPVQLQHFRPVRGSNRPTPSATGTDAFLPLVLANAGPGLPPPTRQAPKPTATVAPAATATATREIPTPTPPRASVTELRVSASVRYAITGRTGTQTVHVYVEDQDGRPIEGAAAQVVVHYPWGDLECTPPPTNATGGTSCAFEILQPTPGQAVPIDVTVRFGDLTASTQVSFMPWW